MSIITQVITFSNDKLCAEKFIDKVLDHVYDNAGEVQFDERKILIAELAILFQNIRKEEICQLSLFQGVLKSKDIITENRV